MSTPASEPRYLESAHPESAHLESAHLDPSDPTDPVVLTDDADQVSGEPNATVAGGDETGVAEVSTDEASADGTSAATADAGLVSGDGEPPTDELLPAAEVPSEEVEQAADEAVDPAPGLPAMLQRLPGRLLVGRIMALVPDNAAGSLVGAVEVMVQEGVDTFSLPGNRADELSELAGMFGPRASFAAHDVHADNLDEVLAGPAEVVALRMPEPGLVARVREAGRAVLVPALTPTEVQRAWDLDVDAVVVLPAEVMGANYAEALAELAPGVTLAARGGLGAYSARRWVEAGAAFVCLDQALLGDAMTGGPLGGLRERCQTFVTAVAD